MKRTLAALIVLMLALPTLAQTPTSSINDVGWLAGEWKAERKGRIVEEHWIKPSGGTMMAISRTVAKDKTVEFEYLRIVEREGKLVYIAQPGGRPATEFTSTSVSADQVTFENPQHDFPKRVIYKKTSDKCVTASIDGGEGTRKIEFPYCRP